MQIYLYLLVKFKCILFFSGDLPEKSLKLSRRFPRGVQDSDALTSTAVNDDNPGGYSVKPFYSDMKICYATSAGFMAQRDPIRGSWYIESMCSIWSDHAHAKHLDDLLKLVGQHAHNMETTDGDIQTAGNEDRGFYRSLFFHPGLYA